MSGIELISSERARQLSKGFTSEHDAQHMNGELVRFAAYYATPMLWRQSAMLPNPTWARSKTRVQELVTAGALIAAEIDRLQALHGPEGEHDAAGHDTREMVSSPLTAAAPCTPPVRTLTELERVAITAGPGADPYEGCEHVYTVMNDAAPFRIERCSKCGHEKIETGAVLR